MVFGFFNAKESRFNVLPPEIGTVTYDSGFLDFSHPENRFEVKKRHLLAEATKESHSYLYNEGGLMASNVSNEGLLGPVHPEEIELQGVLTGTSSIIRLMFSSCTGETI